VALVLQGTYFGGAELWLDVNASDDVTAVRVVNPTARTVRFALSRTTGNAPMPTQDFPPGADVTISLPGNRRFKWATSPNWIVDAWPL
jgi:hypothetical protein